MKDNDDPIDWDRVPVNCKYPPYSRWIKVMLTQMEKERLELMAQTMGCWQMDIIRYALLLSLNSWSKRNNLKAIPPLGDQWKHPKRVKRQTDTVERFHKRDRKWLKAQENEEE